MTKACFASNIENSMLCSVMTVGGSCSVVSTSKLAAALLASCELFARLAGKLDKTGQQMNVWENFRDYNLTPPIGLIRADAHRLPFRPALQVHSTIPVFTMFALSLLCR